MFSDFLITASLKASSMSARVVISRLLKTLLRNMSCLLVGTCSSGSREVAARHSPRRRGMRFKQVMHLDVVYIYNFFAERDTNTDSIWETVIRLRVCVWERQVYKQRETTSNFTSNERRRAKYRQTLIASNRDTRANRQSDSRAASSTSKRQQAFQRDQVAPETETES